MISTEINILDHVQLPEEDLTVIRHSAYRDCVDKLMQVSDDSINEFELEFSYDFICKVTIKPKP